MRMGRAGVLLMKSRAAWAASGACCGFRRFPSGISESPIKTSYDCKAAGLGCGNVFGPGCVERNTARTVQVLRSGGGQQQRASRMRTMGFFTGDWTAILGAFLFAVAARAQAPPGPLVPQPGVTVQRAPAGSTIKLRSVLVNTPVTVRDASGEMVHTLEAKDFRLTDNGVGKKITHFDLGGDPISLVVVVETSSRIDALMPQIRKTGILLTQAVTGPRGGPAIVG